MWCRIKRIKIGWLLSLLLAFLSCNNRSHSDETVSKTAVSAEHGADTSALPATEAVSTHIDTVVQASDTFLINRNWCRWKFTGITYAGKRGKGTMTLMKHSSNTVLLEDEDDFEDVYGTIDFAAINERNFKDANFDGGIDYVAYSRTGSGSGGEAYNIYFFDKKSGKYTYSNLSGAYPEFDSLNKTLTTSWNMGVGTFSRATTYFAKDGKVKYTDVYSEEPGDEEVRICTTKRIVNGKVNSVKTDTLPREDFDSGN